METSKSTIISHLYEHMDEVDWLDGLDIYQAGHVTQLRAVESLIMSKVASTERMQAEVRIKIHPSGGNIQWIECTCRKNRALGKYCEHIAATMIHIDREKPKIFAGLDPKMPLKPPVGATKRRGLSPEASATPRPEKKVSAAQSMLSHMEGQIHSVALLAKGPELRIRVEMKPGQLTSYNLELDDAAQFLSEHQNLECLNPEVRKLQVYKDNATLGTRISQKGNDGDILAERVLGISLGEAPEKGRKKSPQGFKHEHLSTPDIYHVQLEPNTKNAPHWMQFISFKALTRHIGKRYIYLEEVGYIPYDASVVKPAWSDMPFATEWQGDDAARLCTRGFSEYLAAGPIWTSPEIDTTDVIHDAKFTRINVLSINDDWFNLSPEYEAGNERVSMVDILLEYRKKKREYLRAGGKWLKIPDIVTQFPWDIDEHNKALRVDRIGMIRLKASLGEFDKLAGSKKMLDKIREQTEFSVEKEPPTLSATQLNLRQYQKEGYQWLWWLYQNGLSGLLADEMGLGKTHQAMAVMSGVQTTRQDAKFLVICPTTVLDHWQDKIEQFAPKLRPLKYHGSKRQASLSRIGKENSTLLSSYGIIMRDIDSLAKIEWDTVILDEAHFVKNIDTATYRAVCMLKAKSRFCLSGTPMENHLGELKAVFDFLLPGYLGSKDYFRQHFLNPIVSGAKPNSEVSLQKLIHPFKMRRTKSLVLKDLPEKVEDLRHCQLSEEQATMYRQTLDLKARPLLDIVRDENQAIPYLHIFSVITLLKQIADHPAMLLGKDQWRTHQSGKFELFKELIDEAMESGHKVVVYSQYLDMLSIITEHLRDQSIDHELLTGSTRNRGDVIRRFQEDEKCKIFCASLLAGGIGIDLTSASVVIHYDRWWNPSKENQATDRVHRIGQNKNVQVLKLITRNTLEEKIDALINKKKVLIEKFLDLDEEVFKSLSRSDIIELLE